MIVPTSPEFALTAGSYTPPKMRLVLGNMDPIIEDHEKKACSVQRSQVDRMFARQSGTGSTVEFIRNCTVG